MSQPIPPPTPTVGFEDRVGQYVKLRDIIKAKDDAHKQAMKPLRDVLDTLEGIMLTMLQSTKQDSAATKHGTVYKTLKRSATIADGDQFRRHVIGSQEFDLIDWKANKTAVTAYVEEHGSPPPGVNFTQIVEVGVRRK